MNQENHQDGSLVRGSGSTRGLAALTAIAALLCLGDLANAREPIGQNWPAGRQIAFDRVDHSSFSELLGKYVDGDGFVNYRAWKATAADRRALQQYLLHLSQVNPSLPAPREAQLAFWINAYNAVTLEGILREYPTDSIRKHTSKLGGYNIWDDLPLIAGGRAYSLNDIEHKVLRKMNEPRIHFAIVCASIGCPRLLNEAYVADKLESQLSANSRDFFARPQNFMVDSSGTMHVSAILDWFEEDFGASRSERFHRVQPYLPENVRSLAIHPQTRVKYQDYNWSLNDQARKPAGSGRR